MWCDDVAVDGGVVFLLSGIWAVPKMARREGGAG